MQSQCMNSGGSNYGVIGGRGRMSKCLALVELF